MPGLALGCCPSAWDAFKNHNAHRSSANTPGIRGLPFPLCLLKSFTHVLLNDYLFDNDFLIWAGSFLCKGQCLIYFYIPNTGALSLTQEEFNEYLITLMGLSFCFKPVRVGVGCPNRSENTVTNGQIRSLRADKGNFPPFLGSASLAWLGASDPHWVKSLESWFYYFYLAENSLPPPRCEKSR